MEDKRRGLVMSLLKISMVLLILFSPFMTNDTGKMSRYTYINIFIIFIFISSGILYNALDKYNSIPLFISFLSLIHLYLNLDRNFVLLFIIVILDFLALYKLNPFFSLLLLIFAGYSGNLSLLFIICLLLLSTIYYYNYKIVTTQSEFLNSILSEQQKLRNRLHSQEKRHGIEIMQSAMKYENMRLEEMSDLSQHLHDKIGHSISGSIFKLEGAKLMLEKDKDKGTKMIEEVIQVLRDSVDEIRALLRREKPDSGQININKLQMLYNDYSKKYEIETVFEIDGDMDKVTPSIWNVLLDNTIEALTNSLKYSQCNRIYGKLIVFNKIIRYQIKDNGVGVGSIIKGMGLNGIEDRVFSHRGSVSFSGKNGFEINMLLPIGEKQM